MPSNPSFNRKQWGMPSFGPSISFLPQTPSYPTAPVNSHVMPPSNTTEHKMPRRMLKHLPALLHSRSAQCSDSAVFSAAPALRIGGQHATAGSPAPLVLARAGVVRSVRAFAHRHNRSIERTVNGGRRSDASARPQAPLPAAHVGR